MDTIDEARFARLEAQLEFNTAIVVALAGAFKSKGLLGDSAWNGLYEVAEAISRRSGDHWEIGRALRQSLGDAAK